MKNAALARKKRNVALGRRSTSPTKEVARKAAAGVAKKEASPAPAKAAEKADANANGIKPGHVAQLDETVENRLRMRRRAYSLPRPVFF